MKFMQFEFLPALIVAFIVLVLVTFLLERRFFRMVKKYWFYERSLFSYLSTFLFLCGTGGLLLALLDARGPEEKIKAEVHTARTIILIDTSASMLAEDVKPSRLQKATLIAKHFARKAAGQQISIVAFAEIQKKIVPFTNDIDLIDARLESLKNLKNHYGSSALTAALQESIQYFREMKGEARGNILVLTDGEETAAGIDLKIPKEIHVALVGIGTTQGGRIPLDDSRGFRFGYKKDRGQDVITKLNEEFFKRVASGIPSAKYWPTNTYSLPSDEILDFFNSEKLKDQGQQDLVMRPVMMEWIVVPALLLLVLSMLFKTIRVFTLSLFLLTVPGRAQEVELSQKTLKKMERLQNGDLNQLERIKLADELHKEGLKEEALIMYEENLRPEQIDEKIPPEAYLNYGTTLLEKGETLQGLSAYERLLDSLKNRPDKEKKIKEIVEKNSVAHFRQMEEKKKEKEKKDQNKNQENENQDENQGQGQGQSGKDQSKENNSQESSSKQKKNDEQPGDKGKKEEKKEENEDGNEDKQDENKDKDKDKDGPKNLPLKKVPAKLKQLMSDDRQLQMRMIENGTRDMNKRKSRQSKDW